MTRERKLSILPVQRRSPANDIDFIQLCGKYICRIAKGAAELCRESLKRIIRRNSFIVRALIGYAGKVTRRINNSKMIVEPIVRKQ